MPRPHRALGAASGSLNSVMRSGQLAVAVEVLRAQGLTKIVDFLAYAHGDEVVAT